MFLEKNKILVLAPHPDDAEFGLGGTLIKLKELGKEIHLMVFSLCEKSTPKGFKVGVIEKELRESCKYLELKKDHLHILNFEVREFPSNRQQILERMILIRNKINPDLVFLPCSSDIHQDHKTIYEEGVRAFKSVSILGYEMPWNNFGFTSYVYVCLTKHQLEEKKKLLSFYKSQSFRNYSSVEFVDALGKLRGIQIGKEFAESFEMIRWIQD